MSRITDDILLEILARLPDAIHAVRCSTVCKQWRSLISCPQFIPKFIHKDGGSSTFVLLFEYESHSNVGNPFEFHWLSFGEQKKGYLTPSSSPNHWPWPQWRPVASSQVLLLLVRWTSFSSELSVCNPLTRKLLILPVKLPIFRIPVGLACDKLLGYKVVMVNRHFLAGQEIIFDLSVFCSNALAWTRSSFSVPALAPLFEYSLGHAVASDGVVYFPLEKFRQINGVFAYSPFRSICHLFDMPEGFCRGWKAGVGKACLGVVRGRLRVAQMLKANGEFDLKIWELSCDEASASWVLVRDVCFRSDKKARIFMAALHPNDGDAIFALQTGLSVGIYKFGEEVEFKKVGTLPFSTRKLSIYNEDHFQRYVSVFILAHTSLPSQPVE